MSYHYSRVIYTIMIGIVIVVLESVANNVNLIHYVCIALYHVNAGIVLLHAFGMVPNAFVSLLWAME